VKPTDDGIDSAARLRVLLATLQLASPALPVGGFAYSQGLEKAIEDGLVHDAASAQRWIGDLLQLVLARWEAPLFLRAHDAAAAGDAARLEQCNAELLAARETAELRAESLQMGASLLRLAPALRITAPAPASPTSPATFPAAFAASCAALAIERRAALTAYLWAWLENQVLVAVKSVPLGQQAGQQLLFDMHGPLGQAVATAETLGDDELGSAALGFAMIAARHETQYSRLYRS
jgi:urease accessory protein